MARISLGICLVFVIASSVIYEAQGHFLLKQFLRKKFPSKSNEFTPFANKGMLMFVTDLESNCPPTTEFKTFFTQYKSYMTFIESASTSSKNVDFEMIAKCDGIFKAMSALSAGRGEKSADAGSMKATILSMGKTLLAQKKKAVVMTLTQKKELVLAMVKWTRMLATFVKSASEKKGKTINIASYGLDVDVNDKSIIGESTESSSSTKTATGSTTKSGAISGTKTKGFSGGAYKEKIGVNSETKASPSGSTSVGGETSLKGSESATESSSAKGNVNGGSNFSTRRSSRSSSQSQTRSSSQSSYKMSSSTSVRQVESETSKEAMSFIMQLEKKYAAKTELKVFFEKLKASMQASSSVASKTAKDYVYASKSATGKLSEAMALVGSRYSKSAKMKSNMETCQDEMMRTLKQLQDINSKIATSKKVTSSQQTELKQTITKWEQVTTQFVQTAASSSSSSSSSQQGMNSRMVKND